MSFPKVDPKQNFSQQEEEILQFWKKEQIFEQSISQRPESNPYRFYDGPPFITGSPHYGSLLPSVLKDVVPRYWTMQGKRVERIWGWDCHGIPIEQKIQEKMGIESNKIIEEKIGVDKFIAECYKYTRQVSAEWVWYIDHIGRWVDMKHAYKTMDQDYMETVMRVFQQLYQKGLIYKGKRVSLYSRKLGTPISNFEVQMDDSYADVNDHSITVAFDLSTNGAERANTYALVWTTTPRTLPANLALVINQNLEYVKVEGEGYNFILAKSRLDDVFKNKKYELIEGINPNKLIGLKYKPLFEYYLKNISEKEFKIYHADYVSEEDGTGIVHQAPEFGDVDFEFGKAQGLLMTEALDNEGKYSAEIADLQGVLYTDANQKIIEILRSNGVLFKKESITHRVAICPRTQVPLIYKAQDSWFVNIQSLKEKMLAENQKIYWFPEHLKDGRFAKNIEFAPDWCISRTRYRGTPMPMWMSPDKQEQLIVGSRQEIFELNKPYGQICKVILIRHGRTNYNEKSWRDNQDNAQLTDLGKEQAQFIALHFANENIDAIYSSPLHRCIDTITPLAKNKNLQIMINEDLIDINPGKYQDKYYDCHLLKFNNIKLGDTGESLIELYARVTKAFKNIINNNKGKTIVICSHGDPTFLIQQYLWGYDYDTVKYDYYLKNNIKSFSTTPTSIFKIEYVNTDNYQGLDLHKHIIDTIKIKSPTTGATLTRIPEVLDVWMESGSMPYAQMHYPFENQEKMLASFPADYIVEYVGQIRAWFYLMHVVSTALMGSNSFKNVITTGVIFGTDGRKMSKSFKNYPDPKGTILKYGGDAMRLYLLNTPLVAGGDINFSEEGIKEMIKKIMLPLRNTYYFFTTYANIDNYKPNIGNVYLLRHGQTDNNKLHRIYDETDPGLNQEGEEQIHELGKKLQSSNIKFDIVITSDRKRTKQTWEILKKYLPYQIETVIEDPHFGEQLHGGMGGKTHEQLMQEHNLKTKFEIHKFVRFNSSETLDQYINKVTTAYEQLLKKYPDKNILLVTHGGVLRVLNMYLNNLSKDEAFFQVASIYNGKIIKLPNYRKNNLLDKWISSELNQLIGDIKEAFAKYDLQKVIRPVFQFIENLTNWYIRRSRRRFWKSENDTDKLEAYHTLHDVLTQLNLALAPLIPFLAETIYQGLTGRLSVHLELYPESIKGFTYNFINSQMALVQKIITLGLAWRTNHKIRVRQPLQAVIISEKLSLYYQEIIKEELNVKNIIEIADISQLAKKICKPYAKILGPKYGKDVQNIIIEAKKGNFTGLSDGKISVLNYILESGEYEIIYEKVSNDKDIEVVDNIVVSYNAEITPELKLEGYARDIIRYIQEARKEINYEVNDRIKLSIQGDKITEILALFQTYIETETLSTITSVLDTIDLSKDIAIEDIKITFQIKK